MSLRGCYYFTWHLLIWVVGGVGGVKKEKEEDMATPRSLEEIVTDI